MIKITALNKKLWLCAILVALTTLFMALPVSAKTESSAVNVYLFWGQGCPHCAKAKPFLENLASSSANIHLYTYEIYYNSQNQKLLQETSQKLNIQTSGVPLIIIGDKPFVGYSEAYSSAIQSRTGQCTQQQCPDSIAQIVGATTAQQTASPPTAAQPSSDNTANQIIDLPIIGQINAKDFSLPILTVIIAALDGFNPCAMWVLIFLISVLLGMHDRRRMWLLGGAFLAASALVYLLFLTAWLNIFAFIGYVTWVKVLVGLVALAAGGYYLYDFCYNKTSTCKVTTNSKRQQIFDKIRHITHERSFWLALVGIIGLAFAVNLIELVCSAGLPAIYTSILATSHLSIWQHCAYLLLYIIIFMADDLIVFFIAMFTLKVTGMQSKYARFAHLTGGILMLVLGVLMIFAPQILMFG
jgi:glutaredoxin